MVPTRTGIGRTSTWKEPEHYRCPVKSKARMGIEIGDHDRVFVLTGAGVSAESGIPTFRGSGGVWEGYRFEEVASPLAWARDPQTVWRFYSWRREVARGAKPNPAHFALAGPESRLSDRFFLCTQNVDSLHEQAGSKRLLHMHGQLFRSRCERSACKHPPFADEKHYRTLAEVPQCECGGRIRPDICWFGEVPFDLDQIIAKLAECSVFLCVGSSGAVEPAASFVRRARSQGARTYYVGPEEPANGQVFDKCFSGKAGEVLPNLVGP